MRLYERELKRAITEGMREDLEKAMLKHIKEQISNVIHVIKADKEIMNGMKGKPGEKEWLDRRKEKWMQQYHMAMETKSNNEVHPEVREHVKTVENDILAMVKTIESRQSMLKVKKAVPYAAAGAGAIAAGAAVIHKSKKDKD